VLKHAAFFNKLAQYQDQSAPQTNHKVTWANGCANLMR